MGFGVEAYELYNYLQWVLGIMIYIFLPAVFLFKTGKRKEKQGQAFQTQPIFEDRTSGGALVSSDRQKRS